MCLGDLYLGLALATNHTAPELPAGTARLCDWLHRRLALIDVQALFREPARWYVNAEQDGPASALRCARHFLRQVYAIGARLRVFDFYDRQALPPTIFEAIDVTKVRTATVTNRCRLGDSVAQLLGAAAVTEMNDQNLDLVDLGAIAQRMFFQAPLNMMVVCVPPARPQTVRSFRCKWDGDGDALGSLRLSVVMQTTTLGAWPSGCKVSVERSGPAQSRTSSAHWAWTIVSNYRVAPPPPSPPWLLATGLTSSFLVLVLVGFFLGVRLRTYRKQERT